MQHVITNKCRWKSERAEESTRQWKNNYVIGVQSGFQEDHYNQQYQWHLSVCQTDRKSRSQNIKACDEGDIWSFRTLVWT